MAFYHDQIKREVLQAYGGPQCVYCGVEGQEFLQIDHIHNDGAEHRRRLGRTSGGSFYHWLRREGYPPGFQVLCANCNFSKKRYGVCSHQLPAVAAGAVVGVSCRQWEIDL